MPCSPLQKETADFHAREIHDPTKDLEPWEYKHIEIRSVPSYWPQQLKDCPHWRNAICLLENEADRKYAHHLFLHCDETRYSNGAGAQQIADLAGVGEEPINFNTKPKVADYNLCSPREFILVWLECRPQSARAYHLMTEVAKQAKSIQLNELYKKAEFQKADRGAFYRATETGTPYSNFYDYGDNNRKTWDTTGTTANQTNDWNVKQAMRYACCQLLSDLKPADFTNTTFWHDNGTKVLWTNGNVNATPPTNLNHSDYVNYVKKTTEKLCAKTIDFTTWALLIGIHGPVFIHNKDWTDVLAHLEANSLTLPHPLHHGTVSFWDSVDFKGECSPMLLSSKSLYPSQQYWRYASIRGEYFRNAQYYRTENGNTNKRLLVQIQEVSRFLTHLPEWRRSFVPTKQDTLRGQINAHDAVCNMGVGYSLADNNVDQKYITNIVRNAVDNFGDLTSKDTERLFSAAVAHTIVTWLQWEGIEYQRRPTTHREPLNNPWGQVRHVYGKKGVKAEDGSIQHGHWMQLGPKAGQANSFVDRKVTFWLSNQSPPEGTRSYWIPTADGDIREVWFSTAETALEEEYRALEGNRVPYRISSDLDQNDIYTHPTDKRYQGQEKKIPPSNYIVPALTVYDQTTSQYLVSRAYDEDEIRGYVPNVTYDARASNAKEDAVPLEDEERGSVQYNPTVPGSYAPGYGESADYSGYSQEDYSDYSDAYSGGYSDEGYSGYSDEYSGYSGY